ncbi:hypothetical protein Haur_0287 [Herpetosiphon aurantiacus DSM 785]|uniref:Uncharacterized protein n=1 Tax=Herpetosiphon aurantiacus (strain ATCC 23779 / DSM 785 / 114-95) TaxID=316274 RepID=A9B7G6_HERA2|nr:hypothetical protein Haur_0287 [Herpetosiphon aurantiacus DSM 785]
MSTNIDHHIGVEITFDQNPSRTHFAHYYYRAELYYGVDDKQAWCFTMLLDEDRHVMPGETVQACLWFLSPQYQLGQLTVGTPFWLRSAQRLDGTGHVTQITNLEQAVRAKSKYDLPVEVTFLAMPANNPSQVYSLFYGKHLNEYDLHNGYIKLAAGHTSIATKPKHIPVPFEITAITLNQSEINNQPWFTEQHQWMITENYASNATFPTINNPILAKGQGIQLLEHKGRSFIANLTIAAKQLEQFQKATHMHYGFIYGRLFEGENYELNGTERLLILEEGQTVTIGQPVRGHLDLHGIKEHIKALPRGSKFVLRIADQTIAKGRVV